MKSIEQTILEFSQETWGEKSLGEIALKLAEECGEVCGATVKMPEGRATAQDLIDEVGDCLIVLPQLAARNGVTLEEIREARLDEVIIRNTPGSLGVIFTENWMFMVTESTRMMDLASEVCRYGVRKQTVHTIEFADIVREITFGK